MQTSDLIDRLATDLRPVPSGAALMRIATGLLVGGVLALVGILLLLGTDLADALFTRAFWMKWGYGLALAGIVIGIVGALAMTQTLSSLLYGVQATDLLTYTVVPVLLGAVALMATYVPALRATRVDPLTAIRAE